MKQFVRAIHIVYEKNSKQPTQGYLEKQMTINKTRGWPCLFGSIDC